MDKTDYNQELYDSTIKNCKILYKDGCTYWSTNQGWFRLISNFSYFCEELNIRFYKKYRYRIMIEDIKQKYGTLRIYASVVRDPCRIITWVYNKLKNLCNKLNEFNYELEDIQKIKSNYNYDIYIYDTEKELNADNPFGLDMTISRINDKYVKISKHKIYNRPKYKPTKHRVIYYIKQYIEKLSNWIYKIGSTDKETEEQKCISEYMNMMLFKLIDEYENESESVCEKCGYSIDKNNESMCYTTGWINTLCEHCAEKSGLEYEKNGKLYQNGKFIKDLKNNEKIDI